MKKTATWKSLRSDFGNGAIIDAFLGALLYATLFYLPLAVVLVEMLTVYMYLLTLFVILIIISLFIYVLALHYLWWKSLKLKKDAETETEKKVVNTDIKRLFIRNMLIIDIVILALGLVFIFVMIPILWV